ncbi:DUF4381 family protein [Bacteroides uniformis]
MYPELHPLLEKEYMSWWPYAYFFFLLLSFAAGVWIICVLIKKHRHNRPLRKSLRRISHYSRMKDDVSFLKLSALELFNATRSLSGSTYPSEEWLKSLDASNVDFMLMPYRLLLDSCLQPPEAIARLTETERKAIRDNVIELIRRHYV